MSQNDPPPVALRPRRTLLVVDDSEFIRKEIERCLYGQEFDLVLADGGEAGLDMVTLARPDLILLDFLLGDMDAAGFCDRLLAQCGSADTPPVLLVTAYHSRAQQAQRHYPFIVACMTKPFYPDGFRHDLRRVFEHIASFDAKAQPVHEAAEQERAETAITLLPGLPPSVTEVGDPPANLDGVAPPPPGHAEPAADAGARPEGDRLAGEAGQQEEGTPSAALPEDAASWEEAAAAGELSSEAHPHPPPRDPDSRISLNHGSYIPDGRAETLKVFIGGFLADELAWNDLRSVTRTGGDERALVLTFAGRILELFTTERQELAGRLMAREVEYVAGSTEEIKLRKVD